ncbi:MAG TPA: M48 family metalloprotease [Geobacterales bacterium]|nr:M48 family metalloprotease [Geobacterales bacterium]
MNNFFARQEEARRQSLRLILLFALAVAGVAMAVYLVADFIFLWRFSAGQSTSLWHPSLFFWSTAATILFVSLGSYWKIRELRQGGVMVAMMLGAKPVSPQTEEPRERQLRNVVEEMAIASGVPVPDLYIMEAERGINAFAAGYGVNDAVICVTRGALELLDRDELQGVVAHEFSHILNGDMRLNLRLVGWLNGILLISLAGETVLRSMRNTRGRGAGLVGLVALALYIIGYVGYFFGGLIKAAVSRQREYLGDASAVQFTRNPEGLAGALKKIGGLSTGSRLDHPKAAEVSHLFFSSGFAESWLSLLDSHPPLLERIHRLEPRFNGSFPTVTPLSLPTHPAIAPLTRPLPPPSEPVATLSGAAVAGMLQTVGEPVQEHIDRARQLMAQLSPTIMAATRDPISAIALVYALLLDKETTVSSRQRDILAERESMLILNEVARLAPGVASLSPETRLPLLELSLPALRALNQEQYLRLKESAAALSAADNRTSIFEFSLRYLLQRNLEPRFAPRPPRPTQIYGLRGVQAECSCLLSTMARVGHRDQAQAQVAFARGALVLQEPNTEISFLPPVECGAAPLERAFATLEGASPRIKERLLAACLESIIHDGVATVDELELFRAIADAMGCPVPPWLQGGQNLMA